MTKKTVAHSQPREDVLALNVSPERYAQIYEAEPPENLGICLTLVVQKTNNRSRIQDLSMKMFSVGMTFRAMYEFNDFCLEFAPENMRKYTVASHVLELSPGLYGNDGHPVHAINYPTVISVSFFDADKGVDENLLHGFALATHIVDRIATTVGSHEPAMHHPFSLTSLDAAEYRKRVGGLFESERGRWCRTLMYLGILLKVGVHALLDERNLVQSMREFKNTGPRQLISPVRSSS
jgi:hypothetical protein